MSWFPLLLAHHGFCGRLLGRLFVACLVSVGFATSLAVGPVAAADIEDDGGRRPTGGALQFEEGDSTTEVPTETIDPFANEETREEEPELDVAGLGSEAAAVVAARFDPWLLSDVDVEPRRDVVRKHRDAMKRERDDAAVRLADAQRSFERAEAIRVEAEAVAARLEQEMKGFSLELWRMGDDGLQEALGSELEQIRQGEPIRTATELVIERFIEAGVALDEATIAAEAAALVLEARLAAFDLAAAELRFAVQLERQLEARLAARAAAIDRRTHEILEEERPRVQLVTITSVVVRTPVEPPEPELPTAGAQTEGAPESPVDGAPEVQYTEAVVRIPPLVVNASIAENVRALIGAARSDGIDLAGGGHRDRENQIVLRRAHCGTSGYAVFEMPAGECTPPTARPGKSEHELGLAVDFTQNGTILTPGSSGFAWMQANAASYGLINLPSEAWHWSTTGR